MAVYQLSGKVGDLKIISVTVGRKQDKALAIREVGENVSVGTDKYDLIQKLAELAKVLPNDVDGQMENGAYWIVSKTQIGRDALLKEFSQLILLLN